MLPIDQDRIGRPWRPLRGDSVVLDRMPDLLAVSGPERHQLGAIHGQLPLRTVERTRPVRGELGVGEVLRGVHSRAALRAGPGPATFRAVNRVVRHCLGGHRPATSVLLVSSRGLDRQVEVYLDAVAYAGEGGGEDGSTVVRAGDYVFVPNTVGTTPLPAPSRLGPLPDDLAALEFSTPKGADVLRQTWTLFQRLDGALGATGGSIEDILKVN